MPVYLVTWNLNKERRNYDDARKAFLGKLDAYVGIKDALESTRFIHTNATADEVTDDLRSEMDSDDRLFVCKVNPGQRQGWLSQAVWDWINARGA